MTDMCRYEHDGDCCNCGAKQYMSKCKRPCCDEVRLSNGDVIRNMDDDQLADKILLVCSLFWDHGRLEEDPSNLFCNGSCIDSKGNVHCDDGKRKACVIRWLELPAEDK